MQRETTPSSGGGATGAAAGRAGGVRGSAGGRLALGAALAGVALAVALAGYLVFGSRAGAAGVAAQRFCDALVARDYAGAYAELSPALQRRGTEAQFAASQRTLDRLRGPATACSFANARAQGAAATFTLDVTRAGTGRGAGTLRLALVQGGWRVDGYDASVI